MCCQVWQQLICAKLEGAMNSEHFDQVFTHYFYLLIKRASALSAEGLDYTMGLVLT